MNRSLFRDTWLFPRHIGQVYMRQAMLGCKPFAKGVLIDVGCGLRSYQAIFADRVDSYIGIDWPGIAYQTEPDVIGDALHIPIKPGCADTVLATEVMEHLVSPDIFLSEVVRVLRLGGRLILSVPFLEPLHEEPRDYYRFTPFSLHLLLDHHGFCVEKIWSRGGWWSVVLGSFVSKTLYDWANPSQAGERRYSFLKTTLILPFCALAQWLGYTLDHFLKSTKYTMGYVIVAKRDGLDD